MAKSKGKREILGVGPSCPRCNHPSQLVRHGAGNKAKDWAHCKNSLCVTGVFPPNSKKLHLDRVKIGDGPPCFRCLQTTVAWKHSADWKPTPGKGYYLFWYQCLNEVCTTTQIMPPEAHQKPARAA